MLIIDILVILFANLINTFYNEMVKTGAVDLHTSSSVQSRFKVNKFGILHLDDTLVNPVIYNFEFKRPFRYRQLFESFI